VGAKHLFYTSHMGASSTSAFPPMISHAAAESYLQASGVPSTALRNGFYAESMMMYLQEALQTGELNLPEDGPVAWTTHEDLAEATAKLMLSERSVETAIKLTSAEALNFKDIAALASEITGKSIVRNTISDAKFIENLEARGVPSFAIPIAMGLFLASRNGEFSSTEDSTLAHLLGRKPLSVLEFLNKKIERKT
ncbi:MAG: SDR family NAD(P)-dependent oxidoreductase, partial [Proteobacteria bacterium]